nr:intracellular protein transport protein uso1-like [Lolium perenne]
MEAARGGTTASARGKGKGKGEAAGRGARGGRRGGRQGRAVAQWTAWWASIESGEHLEALEEKDLGNLTRVPHTGTTNPEAASNAEIPEGPPPTKRKRGAASGPAPKRARETPSAAATKKLEKEKQRLKEINTSQSSQASLEQFFNKPSKIAGSKPSKKKAKPSPASMQITPEVEVPPKPSSSAAPEPKDVINVDDLPEHTVDSGKDASSSMPPPKEPEPTSAEAPANDATKKLLLSGATAPLHKRHVEMTNLMNQVWGSAETEQQDLATLEDSLRAFFARNKAMRKNTRQLHEDMRTLVLEQKAEIERLNRKEAEDRQTIILPETKQLAKRPSVDDISAKLKVLESENESLKQSLKESHENETKTKKELEDKHTQAMAEMAKKLKTSTHRVKSLSTKLKAAEVEATNVDELIFQAVPEKARTSIIDKMTKLMKLVPELIEDWQESSARGAASIALAMCKSYFPAMDFATIARGVPKGTNVKQALAETQGFDTLFARRVDHSSWYQKNDVLAGFSDDEEDDEAEGEAEGSGSGAHQSDDDSGDASGKDNTYQESEDKPESSE